MIPAYYSVLWLRMTKTANRCGYALALHGSMNRDLDVIAVPWVEDCDTEEVLVKTLAKKHGLVLNPKPTKKPYGRTSYVLMLPGYEGHYIDLSVTPKGETVGENGTN